jgi:hypothetical protein
MWRQALLLRLREAALTQARSALVLGSAAVAASTAGGVGVTGYILHSVHARRRRYYTDSFVLTPEDLNMPYEEVGFFTEDNVALTGWYIPQSSGGRQSRRVVVCCHPYNSNKSNLLGVARGLWGAGFSVFMFDFRSFARSPVAQSLGYYEQRDARAALACAQRSAPEGARLGLVVGRLAWRRVHEFTPERPCARDRGPRWAGRWH